MPKVSKNSKKKNIRNLRRKMIGGTLVWMDQGEPPPPGYAIPTHPKHYIKLSELTANTFKNSDWWNQNPHIICTNQSHLSEANRVPQNHPEYIHENVRSVVPREKIPWHIDFPEYKPISYTYLEANGPLHNGTMIDVADPSYPTMPYDDVPSSKKDAPPGTKRKLKADLYKRQYVPFIAGSSEGKLLVDDRDLTIELDVLEDESKSGKIKKETVSTKGFLLCPGGRTGIVGRGSIWNWGPNHAGDLILTTVKEGQLYFLAALRAPSQGGQWCIPGGMVDPGEAPGGAGLRELFEEVLQDLPACAEGKQINKSGKPAIVIAKELATYVDGFFQEGIKAGIVFKKVVYEGYVDDPRNTDHAWMETNATHVHINELTAEQKTQYPVLDAILNIAAGSESTDEESVGKEWLPITEATIYGNISTYAMKKVPKKMVDGVQPGKTNKQTGVFEPDMRSVIDHTAAPTQLPIFGSHKFLLKMMLLQLESSIVFSNKIELIQMIDNKDPSIRNIPPFTGPAGPFCSSDVGTPVSLLDVGKFMKKMMGDNNDFTKEEIKTLKRYNVCVEHDGKEITAKQPKHSEEGGKKSHRRSSVAHKKSTASHKSAVTKLFQAYTKNRSKIPAKKSLKVVKVRSGRKA